MEYPNITKSMIRRLNMQMSNKELAEFLGNLIPSYVLKVALAVSLRFEELMKGGVEFYEMDFSDLVEEL